ncbi:hypothetical protein PR048_003107 [Dryococelus australis]|uniref:Aminomethyltransferase folate-binding domain-containing protein n=1 Tax=Dryococelus australis TaxID=614101 RepID=A0ABQ9IMP6_9NEOP|nr:hypothetical protein PR048_003107 [Dryococelus australis]
MSIVSWLRMCGICNGRVCMYGVRKYANRPHSNGTTAIECLANRGIIRVSGPEVSGFLQGLITNDMRHFEEGACSMYTFFLNIKGRVLCDTIIYRTEENNVYFIECDANFVHLLQKHLKLFRVRKKIEIEGIDNLLKVWVVYRPDIAENSKLASSYQNGVTEAVQLDTVKKHFSCPNIVTSRDPRLPALGVRVLCPAEFDVDAIKSLDNQIPAENKINYRMLRYRLGVAEGIDDLPPEKCFPLEVNCDYLHGVSFHKGCYIGQELTARTHHTGVVRKRIMPLIFDLIPKNGFIPDMPIVSTSSPKVIGKLRGAEKDVGLGMLRIAEALECPTFHISDGTGETYKPTWWPQSLPKDRSSVIK